MPQLDVNSFISQLFWLALIFTFLYIMLAKVIVPSVREILRERRRTIKKCMKSAEKARILSAQIKDECDSAISVAKDKALAHIAEANDMLKKEIEQGIARLNLEADKLIVEAEANIFRQKQLAYQELVSQTVAIADLILHKVTQGKVVLL
jgi:F-type H+-transporting ATPase subunit b